ncbi:MAG: phage tail protein [Clostridium sp.]
MGVIGSFGAKTFSSSLNKIYTFDDMTENASLNIEEQDVEGQKPSSYIKGPALSDCSLTITLLRQKQVNVVNEINSWKSILSGAKPYPLVIGGKALSRYKYLIASISTSDIKLGPNGEYLFAKVQIQFKEFVRNGKNKDDKNPGKPSGTKKEDKKTKKRKNPNVKKANSNGAKSSKGDNTRVQVLEKELFK